MDNRMKLYQHIVLSGGSTMYPGMPSRMERDIKALYLDRVLKVNLLRVCDTIGRLKIVALPIFANQHCFTCPGRRGSCIKQRVCAVMVMRWCRVTKMVCASSNSKLRTRQEESIQVTADWLMLADETCQCFSVLLLSALQFICSQGCCIA